MVANSQRIFGIVRSTRRSARRFHFRHISKSLVALRLLLLLLLLLMMMMSLHRDPRPIPKTGIIELKSMKVMTQISI